MLLRADYINEIDFDIWQKANIPLSDMSLEAADIDAFRLECVAKVGKGPRLYIDDWQLEAAAAGQSLVTFKGEAPEGTEYHIDSVRFYIVDAYDATLANSSMPNLSYDKFLGLDTLTNGLTLKIVNKGEVKFSINVKGIWDIIRGGAYITNTISDGTNTAITLRLDFQENIILDSRFDDSITIEISDDMSGLIQFTGEMAGRTKSVEID